MMTSGLHPHHAVALTLQTNSENAKKKALFATIPQA